MLSPILDVGAAFLSLQKDPRPDDKAALLDRADFVDSPLSHPRSRVLPLRQSKPPTESVRKSKV
jgi:hypothetical protein